MAKRMNEITPPRRNTRNRPPVIDDIEHVDEPSILQERTDVDRSRRIRTGAILLGVFAGLLLIALLTYTERDEANAQLTFKEMFGALRGDPEVRAKAETTHNGLSLLGAVMSHWLYVSGIGIWSNLLPVMMMFW
ncbi:MAG: DNA translocase FtsK 4TM domain-containing protein, partial [Candidatus Kapaibacteriota bacterium]